MASVNQRAPKGKDLTVFVRFGGLNLKTQKGYGELSYHAPPAPRGIYAFPKVAQELFLIGSLASYQPGVMPKYPKPPQDPREDEITLEPIAPALVSDAEIKRYEEKLLEFQRKEKSFDWTGHWKREEAALRKIRREFVKSQGHIWHHLDQFCKEGAVVMRRQSWVKTSMLDWRRAFSRASIADRYGVMYYWDDELKRHVRAIKCENGLEEITGIKKAKNINQSRKFVGSYSDCDDYEVFFDEKI